MKILPQSILALKLVVSGCFFSHCTQDWWDGVKNAIEKPDFDKKRMGSMFEEMDASLGDCDTAGHGTFRKKFIKVWGGFSSKHLPTIKQRHQTRLVQNYGVMELFLLCVLR